MKYYIYPNQPNTPGISNVAQDFQINGKTISPLIIEGDTLGDAINSYLNSQNTKNVSLSDLNLSLPSDEKDRKDYNLSNLILNKYEEVILKNSKLNNFSFEGKTINSIDLSNSIMNGTNLKNTTVHNMILDNAIIDNASFQKAIISNFSAFNTICNSSDFSETSWDLNTKITNNKKYDFSFYKNVTKGSSFNICNWSKTTIGKDKRLKSFSDPLLKKFFPKELFVAKSLYKGLKGSALLGGGYVLSGGLSHDIMQADKIVTNVSGMSDNITNNAASFLLNHIPYFNNGLDTVSVGAVTIGLVGLYIGKDYLSNKMDKPIEKISKFFTNKASHLATSINTGFANNISKIRNVFSKNLTKFLFGSNRVTSKKILKTLENENHIKIGYGNQEIIVTDDKGANNAINMLLHEKITEPLILSCVSSKNGNPNNIIMLPNQHKIVCWTENNKLVASIYYDENNTVLNKTGNLFKHKNISYPTALNNFIDNLDYFTNKKSAYFSNIKYNADTHRQVIHQNTLQIIRKSDGVLDNDMDFAYMEFNQKNDTFDYHEIHNGTRTSCLTTQSTEPKPELPEPTSNIVKLG